MADRAIHRDTAARRLRAGAPARLFVGCFALVLLFALPAWSGNLVQVRVGNHPTYTRVVFEFDAPSGYRIERRAAGEAENAIIVTLDAASRARNIVSKSQGVESVAVDAGSDRAVARIVTRKAGLPVREMILTDPPRVVLDLLIPGAAPAPKPAVARAPQPVAEPEVEPERTAPEPIVASEPEPSAPEVIAVAEPEPEPQPVVTTPEPEAAPEPVAVVPDVAQAEAPAVDPSAAEAAAADAAVALLETAVDDPAVAAEVAVEPVEVSDADDLAADAELDAEVADAAEAAAPLAVIDVDDLLAGNRTAAEFDAVEPDAPPVAPEVPTAREAARPPTPAHTEATSGGLPFGLDLPLAGMIAAAVAVLLVLVILVVRSRATKPEEMDVTALAGDAEAADDSDEASHEGRIPEGGFAMGTTIDPNSHPAEDFEFGSAEPEAHDDENKPIESADVVLGSTPGLFDESPQEKDAMNMDNQDLPVTHSDSEAPTQLGIGAAAIGSDMDSSVANLMQEMERRMAHMEARLDESNEARERLERQVEAQAEELRVQRAAIARTQRALRSLNRSEEDQATEPALRDPSTPSG